MAHVARADEVLTPTGNDVVAAGWDAPRSATLLIVIPTMARPVG
jgi:hypothetical protein